MKENPIRIVGIAGSLRKHSLNATLLKAAAALVGEGAELEIASISEIPLYNFDVEAQGMPAAVAMLKEKVASSDGLLIATPEYNHSIPGVAKNVIDWLTRPPADIPRVFAGLPVAIMGASPSAFGTALSQNAWLSVLRRLRTNPWFGGRLVVPNADRVFDQTGRIVDEAVRGELEQFVRGFVAFVREQRPPSALS